MSTKTTKGSWRRPSTVTQAEIDLREAIWREKDPDKKEQLLNDLEVMLNQKRWEETEKELPHLWGKK